MFIYFRSGDLNYVMTRVTFCCRNKVRKFRLFLTEVAVKSCIYAQAC